MRRGERSGVGEHDACRVFDSVCQRVEHFEVDPLDIFLDVIDESDLGRHGLDEGGREVERVDRRVGRQLDRRVERQECRNPFPQVVNVFAHLWIDKSLSCVVSCQCVEKGRGFWSWRE